MTNHNLVRGLLLAASLSLAPLAVPSAEAQPATGTATAAVAAQPVKKTLPPGFEPVAGKPVQDQLNPNPLVAGAYAMFFVAMFGYLVYVARGQAAIAQEMAELAERIKKAEKK